MKKTKNIKDGIKIIKDDKDVLSLECSCGEIFEHTKKNILNGIYDNHGKEINLGDIVFCPKCPITCHISQLREEWQK